MSLRLTFLLTLCILSTQFSNGQSVYAPLNTDYQHLIDRLEIKQNRLADRLFTSVKPYERKAIAALADSTMLDSSTKWSGVDRFNLSYLTADNPEWTQNKDANIGKYNWRGVFRNKASLLSYSDKDFDVHANIVGYGQLGRDQETNYRQYINTRGVELRGMVDKRVGFYTFITENQIFYPGYVTQFIRDHGAVPHEGFWKPFGSAPANQRQNGVDFFTGRGYITASITKHIHAQFGHDRHFFGNGLRSMILSDFANNYTFLKLNTNVWKLNYTNLFAQMFTRLDRFESSGSPKSQRIPKKYFALHQLSLNITKNLNIGIFESIVFGRTDPNQKGVYDISYLNPLIFYRAIEQNNGSPDNAVLGADLKWNFLNHFSLYSQIVLDEFLLSEVRQNRGWWGNKNAFQVGLKWIDVIGVRNLDMQVEYNHARPYTYQHSDAFTDYSHYNQALAHPMGANFREVMFVARYQPINRLRFSLKTFVNKMGEDTVKFNNEVVSWGQNPMVSYNRRKQEFNNSIGQGISTTIVFAEFTASYMLFHNFYMDIQMLMRRKESAKASRNMNTRFISASIRWNIPHRNQEF